jgi:hypothetical protein
MMAQFEKQCCHLSAGATVRINPEPALSTAPFAKALYAVEPAYNDIGLYDTTSITSDILWYQLVPHC